MPEWLILLLIGSVAGVLSGMFGIGGGAIIVPSLVIFLGFTLQEANGTSLAALLLPVGFFGALEYYRAGKLLIRPSLALALGLTISTYLGASLALNIPEDALRAAYGVFLLFMAWRYIAPRKMIRELRGLDVTPDGVESDLDPKNWGLLARAFGIGLIAGVASGLFGIGGGVVIVPALMILLRMDQKLATGTSLGALLLPVGLPGVVRYAQDDALSLGAALPLALMLLIGALFGARLTLGLPTKTVRRLYGVFLMLVGLRFIGFFAWLSGLFGL